MLKDSRFENNGLLLVASTHASYIAIRIYDNKYIQSLNPVTNLLVDKEELLAIYNAVTRAKVINQEVENLSFSPIDGENVVRLTVYNHEFDLDYAWLKHVFEMFFSEAQALN